MKMKKIAAFLIAVMCLSLLSGCGAAKDNVAAELIEKYSAMCTLGNYKGLVYTESDTQVTESVMQSYRDSLISQGTVSNPIMEGIATYGDIVNIDYVGTIDGVEFDGGSTQGAGTEVTLGNSGYIDNFDEQIAGHSPGDTFDVNVTFPEDYGVEELNGKAAVFNTTLNYIVEKVEPEYDDALIATLTDYKTVAEYEEATRAELEEQNSETDANTNKQNVLLAAIDSSTINEYPENEIRERVDNVMANVSSTAESNGIDVNTLLTYYGYSDADEFQEDAEKSIKKYLDEKIIVCAIAKAENLGVTEKELADRKQELLSQYGLDDVAELETQYGYKEEDITFIILEDKVLDILLANANPVQADTTETTE